MFYDEVFFVAEIWQTFHQSTLEVAQAYLYSVVDKPLKGSQGSNHDGSRNETSPETLESKGLGRWGDGWAFGLVHVRDYRVRRMRYDGTNDWKKNHHNISFLEAKKF